MATPSPDSVVDVGDEVWVSVPPGWIELVAHTDDDEALRWFERLLDCTPDLFDAEAKAHLLESFTRVRRELPRENVDSAGALLTLIDDDMPTMWQFTVAVTSLPTRGDLNLMAVVERFLQSQEGSAPLTDPDDMVETFTTADGRDGVAIHTTASIDDEGRLAAHLPHADAARLGVVYAAVRLNRPHQWMTDRLAIITAVAPNVAERLAMSVVAAQLTLSVQLRDSDGAPPPGRVDVDATGHRRDEADRNTE